MKKEGLPINRIRKSWLALATAVLALVLLVPLVGWAEEETPMPPDPKAAESAAGIMVYVGQSQTITTSWPVKRVSVADPNIADVQVLTPKQILALGKAPGSTDLIVWDNEDRGERMRVDVTIDISSLKADLAGLFPQSTFDLTPSHDAVIVRGVLDQSRRVDELDRYFKSLGLKYVNMTTVAGSQQVLIKVRVAEVSRTALRAMGFNLLQSSQDFFGAIAIGSRSGPLNPISVGIAEGTAVGAGSPFVVTPDLQVSSAVTVFGGFPHSATQFFLQALAENQYLRVLAEPNLVTLSGEEASFLAGGEFPIPVVQGSGTGGTSISVEYREFGVRLRFRPLVLGEGRIRLHVAPEVSSLTDVGAVEIQGFRIPALTSRKSEATLELNSGETFAMAGLINKLTNARTSRIPYLGSIPVLGALFRSVRYQQDETELVVLVTAFLVEPMTNPESLPIPGVLHTCPNDWEFYLEGRISGQKPAKLSAADAEWLKGMGLSSLVGPGAWESYGEDVARSSATIRAGAPTGGDLDAGN